MSSSEDDFMSGSDSDDFEDEDENIFSPKGKKKPAPSKKVEKQATTKKVTSNSKRPIDDGEDENKSPVPQCNSAKKSKPTSASAITSIHKASVTRESPAPAASSVSVKPHAASLPVATSSSFSSSASAMAIGDQDITRGPDVTSEAQAKKLIMTYFRQQNRPFGPIQIYENLHKRIQKPTVERVLKDLSKPGSLVCKEYKQAKIYFPDQASMNSNASAAEIRQLEDAVNALSKSVEGIRSECGRKKARLVTLQNEPDDDEIDRAYAEIESRVKEKEKRLAEIDKTTATGGPAGKSRPDVKTLIKTHNKYRNAWRDRKTICRDALEIIADQMEKKMKSVVGDMGIETDEDFGVQLPALIVEPKKEKG